MSFVNSFTIAVNIDEGRQNGSPAKALPSEPMKRAIFLLLLDAIVAAKLPAQAVTPRIGVEGGFTRLKPAGTGQHDYIDRLDLPGSGLTSPTLFLVFPVTPRIAVEPSLSANRDKFTERSGLCIAVRHLAPVRLVDRPRRDSNLMTRTHVIPPEQIGGGETRIAPLTCLPDFLTGNKPVRLSPQPNFEQIAKKPAIGDDAMIARQAAGHEGCLHRASDRRRHRGKGAHGTCPRKRRQARRLGPEMTWRQADHKDDNRLPHWHAVARVS